MAKKIKLIVGLGNRGEEYKNTPHNIGFRIIDNLLSEIESLKVLHKFGGDIFEDKDNKIIYLKPMDFMNNSGKVILDVCNKYKIDIKNILVIHDDLDFAYGYEKLDFNRSSAGHKGVQSIIDCLNRQDFYRLRVGVMPEKKPENVNNYLTRYNVIGVLKEKDNQVIIKSIKIVKFWIADV